MKKFVRQIFLFGLLLLILYGAAYLICNLRNVRAVISVLDCEVISPCNSHEQCGIDPEVFPEYGNFNSIATPPWVWESKLQFLFMFKRFQPKILLIDRGCHEVLFGCDLDATASVVARFLPFYLGFSTCRPHDFEWRRVLHYLAGDRPFTVKWAEPPPMFMPKAGAEIEVAGRLRDHFKDWQAAIPSEANLQVFIKSLEDLILLARSRHIQPVFISTPKLRDYLDGVPPQITELNRMITDSLVRKHNVKYLDYSCLDWPADCFGDADHLNSKGRREFTKILRKDLGYED